MLFIGYFRVGVKFFYIVGFRCVRFRFRIVVSVFKWGRGRVIFYCGNRGFVDYVGLIRDLVFGVLGKYFVFGVFWE